MPATILIVDDSSRHRASLRKILSRSGFELVPDAATGVEAVKRYLACRPDLVLMDLVMPKMSGIEAARVILKSDPDAKIIAVSGLYLASVRKEATTVGMKGFVPKPVDPQVLIRKISEHTDDISG